MYVSVINYLQVGNIRIKVCLFFILFVCHVWPHFCVDTRVWTQEKYATCFLCSYFAQQVRDSRQPAIG